MTSDLKFSSFGIWGNDVSSGNRTYGEKGQIAGHGEVDSASQEFFNWKQIVLCLFFFF